MNILTEINCIGNIPVSKLGILANSINNRRVIGSVGINVICAAVAYYFNMPIEQLKKKQRNGETIQSRQIAMYFAKELTKTTFKEIGQQIGNKNHATVIHSCNVVRNLIETDKKYRRQIMDIEQILSDLT